MTTAAVSCTAPLDSAAGESVDLVLRCANSPPPGWNEYVAAHGRFGFHLRAEWADVFRLGLGHRPWFLSAERRGALAGVLPLMEISGPLFGRFLCSQPYLNSGGVLADSRDAVAALLDRAVALADTRDVRRLELRHEQPVTHPGLNDNRTEKVHMRRPLPATTDALWTDLKSKVRSQIRRPLRDASLTVTFGSDWELDAFYDVFCVNMRDLGTPPWPRALFACLLEHFAASAEIGTVRLNGRPVAAGLLVHGPGTTFVPSASSLRKFNSTSANMLLYWHLLCRAIERGQTEFDFGRSTPGSGTWRFKRQFGAQASPAVWQYANRRGATDEMRPGSGRFDRLIDVWKRLPVWITRLIGPSIVRGIP